MSRSGGSSPASGPRVTAVAQDERSQARNRELALERLARRLSSALAVRRAPPHDAADQGLGGSAG